VKRLSTTSKARMTASVETLSEERRKRGDDRVEVKYNSEKSAHNKDTHLLEYR
jgi:hypothetical protein